MCVLHRHFYAGTLLSSFDTKIHRLLSLSLCSHTHMQFCKMDRRIDDFERPTIIFLERMFCFVFVILCIFLLAFPHCLLSAVSDNKFLTCFALICEIVDTYYVVNTRLPTPNFHHLILYHLLPPALIHTHTHTDDGDSIPNVYVCVFTFNE